MKELKLGGKYRTAVGHRRVTITLRGANYAMGTFSDTGDVEYWNMDGTHEDGAQMNLEPDPLARLLSPHFRIAWMIGCAIVGLLIGAAVYYSKNPPH